MNQPLVSVICLCYNHASFVREAIDSVLNQSYDNVEIIIVDDNSIDNSNEIISELVSKHPEIIFIKNESNIGNCKSFNKALKIAKGEYIIDFATDDILHTQRIEKQVKEFQSLSLDYGVIYSDVISIDLIGNTVKENTINNSNPSGEVYKELVRRFFISTPGMMIRKEVLDFLGGYDESLAYEDFDFWVRSSRVYKYHYQKESLTKKRIVPNSLSSSFFKKRETILSETTYRVVLKALWLNKNKEEDKALAERIKYEMRHALYIQNFALVIMYYKLLKEIKMEDIISKIVYSAARLKLPVFEVFKLYSRFR